MYPGHDRGTSPGMTTEDTGPGPGSTGAPHAEGTTANAVTRRVAASPEQVFEVISSGWLYPVWVVGAARMRNVDPGWPAPGTKLHHSFGLWPALLDDETEVLTADPPRHVVLQARGWPAGEATVDLRITPDGVGGCTVQLSEDATHGPGRLVPHLVRRAAVQVRNRESLRRLAFIAEGMATPRPGPPAP